MRKCVVSMEQHPKQDLIRIVYTPDQEVRVDRSGKMNGRGAYLKHDKETVLKAQKTRALGRVLKTDIPQEIYDELLSEFES